MDTHDHIRTHTITHNHTRTHTNTHGHTRTHMDTHGHTQTQTHTHACRQFFAGNCYGKHGPAKVPAPETLAPETLAPLQGQEGLGNKARAQRVSRVAGRHGETRKAARWASRKEVATHVRPIQKPEFEARLPPHTAPTSKIYKWHASPWGVCSLSCGEGGIRLRKVTCQSATRTSRYREVIE